MDGNCVRLICRDGHKERVAIAFVLFAEMGTKNGWQGVIINGCLRDSEDIGKMNIGVKALGTHPLKSSKRDPGQDQGCWDVGCGMWDVGSARTVG